MGEAKAPLLPCDSQAVHRTEDDKRFEQMFSNQEWLPITN